MAFGAVALGVCVGGCAGGSTTATGVPAGGATRGPAASPTVAGARKGGTLTIAVAAQMTDLHPHISSSESNQAMKRQVYDPLFYNDFVNNKVEFATAQSVEIPDNMTYIFKLRPNAKFQNVPPANGRTVTGQDLVEDLQAYIANPRGLNRGFWMTNCERYEAPDAGTFIIRMKRPNAWAMGPVGFGDPSGSLAIPRELLAGDQLSKVGIGTGAYVLDEFDPASTISFKRRPDGWYPTDGRPYIDRVVERVITDTAARSAALKAKQIDTLAARDKLEAEEFKSYGSDMVIDKDLAFPTQFFMRADDQGYFKDQRVRQAVYCALDIKELIDKVALGEGEWTGPVSSHLKAWALPEDEVKKQFPRDLAKARALLGEAGWNSNTVVDLKHPSTETAALLAGSIQKQLEAAGLRTRLVPQDSATVFTAQTITNRDFQLAVTPQRLVGQDPDVWLRFFTTEGIGGGNTSRWSDNEVDDIVARQMLEFDEPKQRSLILQAERMLFAKFAPIVNLYIPYVFAARWGYFHPVPVSARGYAGSFGHYRWTEKP